MKKVILPVAAAVFLFCSPALRCFGEETLSYCVYFADEEDENHFIFNPQRGRAGEGEQISVAFPEKIIGGDGFFWEASAESPQVFSVYGSGTQKFYIGYRRGEWAGASSEEEEEQEEAAALERWLDLAWRADCVITGQNPEAGRDPYLTVSDRGANNRRITSILSMVPADNEWHYFYMIGKNYIPDTTIIGLEQGLSYSAVTAARIKAGGENYHIVRTGVCRRAEQAEENTGIPGSWREGDVITRQLGNRKLWFTCVDEDYDAGAEHQKAALFLCDTLIRADADSDEHSLSVLKFGADNNYRFSRVRDWLREHGKGGPEWGQPVPTGLQTAYGGSTEAGVFEQLSEHSLRRYDIGFQQIQDNMFCLSVEEALKYRSYLWRFAGSKENNPQTQLSPYSRGYYLRTPVYEEDTNGFCHGNKIYVVDLEQGNIHPAETDSEVYGIRPAFALPQD